MNVSAYADCGDRSADGNADFPVGGGELGGLIRNYDWSRTSLGPIESWPQSLKTATDIVLRSPLPLVMLWGRDGIMLYNDAYAIFAGARHPRLLGSKVLEGWPEVAEFNARVMEVGLAGGTLSFKDQELTLYRNDVAEQVWMDLNYGPVLDESGRPGGVLAIVVETTSRVLAGRRQGLLFQLGEDLRDMLDPTEIVRRAAAMLGSQLEADRAGWTEIDQLSGMSRVRADWTRGDMPSMAGEHRLAIYAPARLAALCEGRTVRTDDVQSDPIISDDTKASYAARLVAAGLTVPIAHEGTLRAAFFVHSRTKRHWTEEEEALVRDVAARTWIALRRAQAEARLRDSEERFRALVKASSDAIYRMSADWTEMRRLDGRGFLSDTDKRSTSWLEEYSFPEDRPRILASVREAVRSKKPFELEHRIRRIDGSVGWTLSRAIPLFDEQGGIIEWFGAASDVTARKQAEEHLHLVVNELNHRVKNNLAMMQAIAAQTFRNSEGLAQAEASFSARIMALARANDLLTQEGWFDLSLEEVIDSVIRPHCGGEPARCIIAGPPVRLSAKTLLSLSMGFHELATNAVKYGAWSTASGAVQVTWKIDGEGKARRLLLEWRERGGPKVAVPRRRGFGSRLIERGLAAELEGKVALRFEPEGLVCEIAAPLRSDIDKEAA